MIGPSAVFMLCAVVHNAGVLSAQWRDAAQVFPPAGRFEADTTVLVNEAARRDREVGYKIKATLDVAPVWSRDSDEFFLKFDLYTPKLHLRGKHVNAEFLPHESVLDSYMGSTFYAHWKHGVIEDAYLDPGELVDMLNYKKSLISLFQFQSIDGEYNETDISGECQIYYETVSEKVFRKIKRHCNTDGEASWSRRLTRYSVGAGAGAGAGDARELHAEEVVVLGHAEEGLKARVWHALRTAPAARPAAPQHATLDAALQAVPPHLQPMSLTLPIPDSDIFDLPEYASVDEAVEQNLEALEGEEAGAGGEARAALAALRLLPALRRAAPPALRELLHAERLHHLLPGLCRMLGLAGTHAALAAADEALHLRARDPLLAPALTYLQAFALADGPPAQEGAILEVLRLGEEAKARAVADSALLAASSAAYRHASVGLSDAVRDSLTLGLARCKDEECRRVRLQALGNLRRADTADLLVEHAGGAPGAAGGAALAALDALAQAPRDALLPHHLHRLTHVALDDRAVLEVRAAALDLVMVRRAKLPTPLARVAGALHAGTAPELRRLFWQRLDELAARHAPVAALLPALPPRLRTWHARAAPGTSSVLRRDTGWRWAGRTAALESVQVAHAGLLRRGRVRLLAADASGVDAEVLAVEVWTRGLEAIAGGTPSDESETRAVTDEESVAGGLAVSVSGSRMRGVTLFDGQAELLGHVWAGAGSAPTPALRALVADRGARGRVPTLAGAVLSYRARAAIALAIDAHAQVSLWWRTARAGLAVRAAVAGEVEAALAPAWGAVRARALSVAQPRLRIAADLDFYDKLALCVRTRTDDHQLSRNVTLESTGGARRLSVRRTRAWLAPAAGRTLSLGADNDRACGTLRAADDDDDARE